LIIGTGLSIAMDIPGMSKLAEKLEESFKSINDLNLQQQWNKYKGKIKDEGLEAALLDVFTNEESFVETIRNITSEFILDEEYNKHSNVFNNTYGFEKLLKYEGKILLLDKSP